MRLDAQLKSDRVKFAVVVADFEQEIIELQTDLKVATEVFGVGKPALVLVVVL